jgi:alkylated DNA repair dioxygenase AlkB
MSNIIFEKDGNKLWEVLNFTEDKFEIFNKLELDIKPIIYIFGKECHQRRDVGHFSDVSSGYKYSNQIAKSSPLTIELKELMEKINSFLGTDFNGILVNKYNDGTEYIGAHSDSKVGLSKGSIVVGICYGSGIRKFRIRDKKTKKIILDHDHQPHSLLIMDGNTFQDNYTHEIPQQKKIKGSRISLTFRVHTE